MPTICTTVISSFRQDVEGHWIANLACGHSQHVRNRPPWEQRPWVTSEAGRAEKIGTQIDCPRCEMPVLPPDAREYKRTATFTEATIPSGLLRDHRTKDGTWARIVVEAGRLRYGIEPPRRTFVLTPEYPGIAPPMILHQVDPLGAVSFHVEFLRIEP